MMSRSEMRELAVQDPYQFISQIEKMSIPDLAIAAEYLGTFADANPDIVECLTGLLEHEEVCIRESAIYGLSGQTDLVESRIALKTALLDDNHVVREAAQDILELCDDE